MKIILILTIFANYIFTLELANQTISINTNTTVVHHNHTAGSSELLTHKVKANPHNIILNRPRAFLKLIPNYLQRNFFPLQNLNTLNTLEHRITAPTLVISPLNRFKFNRNGQNTVMSKPDHNVEFNNHINRLKLMSKTKNVTAEAIHLLHDEEQKLIRDYYQKKHELSDIKSFFTGNNSTASVSSTSTAMVTAPNAITRLNNLRHRPYLHSFRTPSSILPTNHVDELSKLNHTYQMNATLSHNINTNK